LDLRFSNEELDFREEVREFLARDFTPELRAAAARQAGIFADYELTLRWWSILCERGWIAPSWPKEYGGTGWSPVERYLFDRECAIAGTPVLPAMGLVMCGPVLMRFGTAEQKAYFLPRIRSGECFFCQGYSEPQAGSDLAALATRAVLEDGHYVINGTKIWTTYAHHANWMFALVRTSIEGKPQAGITFLLLPMSLTGIQVRPIISISADHDVNQVFFTDVRVPVANRVGEENGGWQIAKYLLEFERGGHSHAARVQRVIENARALIAECRAHGAASQEARDLELELAELEIANMSIEMLERRMLCQVLSGKSSGDAGASTLKLLGAETLQAATDLAMRALGEYACVDQRLARGSHPLVATIGPKNGSVATARYLNMRAASIFGGSTEIQRNILARAALGL
jgi:alkylation response protein AidB-like acyl-CoA dehydrogenase